MKQRRGRVFKRCNRCRARVEERTCPQCSSRAWSWAFVVDIAPPGGKRKQIMRSGFPSKSEAVRALTELQSSVSDGTRVEPSKLTVRDYLTGKWLPAIRATVRTTTLRGHEQLIRVHVIPRLGDTRLQAVDGGVLNGLYADLLESGRSDGTGGLSAGSVRRLHAVLHRAFRDAVRWHLLIRNPADDADPPKTSAPGSEMRTWTPAQLRRFLAHAASEQPSRTRLDEHGDPVTLPPDRLYPLYVLLATTGMRRGEVCGLRWTDVDLDARCMSIRQTRSTVGHQVTVGEPKTRKGKRNIALDGDTVAVLRAWRTYQLGERLRWGEAWTDTGLVFTREDGAGVHPDRVSKAFRARVAEAGVPPIRLHDLRHTHATMALEARVHPKVISERLGHAAVSMTLDVYSHAIPALQAEAADIVAGLVFADRDAM